MKMYLGCAQRGRYQEDGKIEQQIEVRDDELSNAITTVNKDLLVIEIEKQSWLEKKYAEFYKKMVIFQNILFLITGLK